MSLKNNENSREQDNITIEPIENESDGTANIDNDLIEQFTDDEEREDINEQNKMNKVSKIFLYVVSTIIIILCLIVLAKNLFFNKSNKDNSLSSVSTSSSSMAEAKAVPAKIKDLYILGNLTDGYELSNQDISDTKVVTTYKNKTNEIVFTQSTIKGYKPEYDTSDENLITSHFSRGDGQDFTAYKTPKNCYIVWTTNEYTFEIKTTMKKSESIPFIFNVQKAADDASSKKSE